VVDDAGIRLLCLVGFGNIDQMHHGLAFAVHPGTWKREIRPGALFQPHHVLIEPDGIGKIPGPDIEMVEYADADAHVMSRPFLGSSFDRPILAQNRSLPPKECPPNEAVALRAAGFMVRSRLQKWSRPVQCPALPQGKTR